MWQWNEALELFGGRFSIEMQYELSKMHFECINAYLFEMHEMFSDAREYYDRAAKSALRAVDVVYEYLKKLKPYIVEDAGYCARAARELWALSGAQNSCGDTENAGKTLDEAAALYEALYKSYGNLYAQAMYLQTKVFRYIQLLQQGQADPEKIEALDRERKAMLSSAEVTDFERFVGESVGVMIDMYRGFFSKWF